jgi:hypothetical protein
LCGEGEGDVLFKANRLCLRHAEIVLRQDEFFVVAKTDSVPVSVNGKPVVGETPVREQDVVTVGDSEIRFRRAPADEPGREDALSPFVRRPTPGMGIPVPPDRTMRVSDFVAQSRAMRVLANATASLLVHHPFPVLFDRILDLVFEAVPADFAAIMLLGEGQEPVLKAGRDRAGHSTEQRISQAIVRKVVEGRVAVMAGDVLEDANLRRQPGLAGEPLRRVICAPLWVSTRQGEPVRVLGVLYASARVDRVPFRGADLEILTVLANTAAAKIETAWLLEAGMEQRRLQEDLRVAAEIQASLLPQTPARVPGYDLAGRTQSSRAVVGGTQFDHKPAPPGTGRRCGQGRGGGHAHGRIAFHRARQLAKRAAGRGRDPDQWRLSSQHPGGSLRDLLPRPAVPGQWPTDLRECGPQPALAGGGRRSLRDTGRGRDGVRFLPRLGLRRGPGVDAA